MIPPPSLTYTRQPSTTLDLALDNTTNNDTRTSLRTVTAVDEIAKMSTVQMPSRNKNSRTKLISAPKASTPKLPAKSKVSKPKPVKPKVAKTKLSTKLEVQITSVAETSNPEHHPKAVPDIQMPDATQETASSLPGWGNHKSSGWTCVNPPSPKKVVVLIPEIDKDLTKGEDVIPAEDTTRDTPQEAAPTNPKKKDEGEKGNKEQPEEAMSKATTNPETNTIPNTPEEEPKPTESSPESKSTSTSTTHFTEEQDMKLILFMKKNNTRTASTAKAPFEALLSSLGFLDENIPLHTQSHLRTKTTARIREIGHMMINSKAIVVFKEKENKISKVEFAAWTDAWLEEGWKGSIREDGKPIRRLNLKGGKSVGVEVGKGKGEVVDVVTPVTEAFVELNVNGDDAGTSNDEGAQDENLKKASMEAKKKAQMDLARQRFEADVDILRPSNSRNKYDEMFINQHAAIQASRFLPTRAPAVEVYEDEEEEDVEEYYDEDDYDMEVEEYAEEPVQFSEPFLKLAEVHEKLGFKTFEKLTGQPYSAAIATPAPPPVVDTPNPATPAGRRPLADVTGASINVSLAPTGGFSGDSARFSSPVRRYLEDSEEPEEPEDHEMVFEDGDGEEGEVFDKAEDGNKVDVFDENEGEGGVPADAAADDGFAAEDDDEDATEEDEFYDDENEHPLAEKDASGIDYSCSLAKGGKYPKISVASLPFFAEVSHEEDDEVQVKEEVGSEVQEYGDGEQFEEAEGRQYDEYSEEATEKNFDPDIPIPSIEGPFSDHDATVSDPEQVTDYQDAVSSNSWTPPQQNSKFNPSTTFLKRKAGSHSTSPPHKKARRLTFKELKKLDPNARPPPRSRKETEDEIELGDSDSETEADEDEEMADYEQPQVFHGRDSSLPSTLHDALHSSYPSISGNYSPPSHPTDGIFTPPFNSQTQTTTSFPPSQPLQPSFPPIPNTPYLIIPPSSNYAAWRAQLELILTLNNIWFLIINPPTNPHTNPYSSLDPQLASPLEQQKAIAMEWIMATGGEALREEFEESGMVDPAEAYEKVWRWYSGEYRGDEED